MTTPNPLLDLDHAPDLSAFVAELGRQLHALDLRSLTARDALDLMGVLLRISGRETSR